MAGSSASCLGSVGRRCGGFLAVAGETSGAGSRSGDAGARLLRGPCKALAVLRDHAGSVSSLSLCGEFLLTASTGGVVVAWQQPDLRRFARFGHGGSGGSIKALPATGGRVFSAHQDSRVHVWRVSRRSRYENAFKLIAIPSMETML